MDCNLMKNKSTAGMLMLLLLKLISISDAQAHGNIISSHCTMSLPGRPIVRFHCRVMSAFIDNNETLDRYDIEGGRTNGRWNRVSKDCIKYYKTTICVDRNSLGQTDPELKRLNSLCRGGAGNDPRTWEACKKRDSYN